MNIFWKNRYETNYKEQNYEISIQLLDYKSTRNCPKIYKEYYSDQEKEYVGKLCKDEIKQFNYSF